MKTIDIKMIEKNISDLDSNDNWVLIKKTMYRYMFCGRTILHNHKYWKFKRINIDGSTETQTITDGNEKIICLNWE